MKSIQTEPRDKQAVKRSLWWANSVPSHWNLKRNLGLFEERDERGKPELELLAVTTRDGILRQSELEGITERKNTASEDRASYKVVHEGDIVYNKMRMWQGAVGVSRYHGIVSPAYVVLRPRAKISSRYFFYQFKTSAYITETGRYSYGLCDDMKSLRYDDFKTLYSLLPPSTEQECIAAFLDRQTAQIDELIQRKEQLLELHEERRAAVLTNYAYGPCAQITLSEVARRELMESPPPGWNVVSFRRCAAISEGQVDPGNVGFRDCVLLAPNHVESGTGRILFTETSAEQVAISGKYRVRTGELIYSKIRPALNKVCIAPFDCLCSADMYALRTLPGTLPEYLLYVMLSVPFVETVTKESMRVAMPKVNRPSLLSVHIPRPEIGIQQTIVAAIAKEMKKIDRAEKHLLDGIDKLREYRSALITAAVTGQLDVDNYRPKDAAAACP
jgi:type I restriction enzyme S subunit